VAIVVVHALRTDPTLRARWGVSSAFGALSATQWSRLCARHLDHHLRQFAL